MKEELEKILHEQAKIPTRETQDQNSNKVVNTVRQMLNTVVKRFMGESESLPPKNDMEDR